MFGGKEWEPGKRVVKSPKNTPSFKNSSLVFISFLILHTDKIPLYLNLINHITQCPPWNFEPCHTYLQHTKISLSSRTLHNCFLCLEKYFTPSPDKLHPSRPISPVEPSPHLLPLARLLQKPSKIWIILHLETLSPSKVRVFHLLIPSFTQHLMSAVGCARWWKYILGRYLNPLYQDLYFLWLALTQ